VQDQHVDRPGVEVGQPMKLTGSDRPIGSDPVARGQFLVLSRQLSDGEPDDRDNHPTSLSISPAHKQHTPEPIHPLKPVPGPLDPGSENRRLKTENCFMDRTTWWLWRGARTRSLPELGRENPQRPWYCVSRHGRVGRRQVFQSMKTTVRDQSSDPAKPPAMDI
jgi:hypothetical protein